MICYLDTSAIVKRYIAEPGTDRVMEVIEKSNEIGTSAISRTEVVAALAKATRTKSITSEGAEAARQKFEQDWPDFIRLQVTEETCKYAAQLAWDHGLRGYDAVHLSSALIWQRAKRTKLTMMTFDRALWTAASQLDLDASPNNLAELLEKWKEQTTKQAAST